MQVKRTWRNVFVCLVFLLAASTLACRDSGTVVWSGESVSPDGLWIASARTLQWAGPGNAAVETEVLLRAKSSSDSIKILGLENEGVYPIGITAVNMKWAAPEHLIFSYRDHATIDFQAVKSGPIQISVEGPPGAKVDP